MSDAKNSGAGPAFSVGRAAPPLAGRQAASGTETAEAVEETDYEERLEDEDEEEEDDEEEEALSPEALADLCGKCKGLCCRYYTVTLKEPDDADDFDEIRWFLAHEDCYVYVDEGEWHLNVISKCRFLDPSGQCLIYEHRPDVCRDFGHEEECEWTGELEFEHVFRTIPELEAYAKEVLSPEELEELPLFPEGWRGPV
ncbi:MAG: YkgJ family cysteine cluster protein [Planctomycetota bacterium]